MRCRCGAPSGISASRRASASSNGPEPVGEATRRSRQPCVRSPGRSSAMASSAARQLGEERFRPRPRCHTRMTPSNRPFGPHRARRRGRQRATHLLFVEIVEEPARGAFRDREEATTCLTDLDHDRDRQIARAVACGNAVLAKILVECAEADDVLGAGTPKRVGPRPLALPNGRDHADVTPEAGGKEGFRVDGVQHALRLIVIGGAEISASGGPGCSRSAPAAGSPRRRYGCRA